jgi:hypothetical protein
MLRRRQFAVSEAETPFSTTHCIASSQASSAGHGEKEVRKKIVETGDVDVMISIRSNFFYTRSVPCELWHFDRAKPDDRSDKVKSHLVTAGSTRGSLSGLPVRLWGEGHNDGALRGPFMKCLCM